LSNRVVGPDDDFLDEGSVPATFYQSFVKEGENNDVVSVPTVLVVVSLHQTVDHTPNQPRWVGRMGRYVMIKVHKFLVSTESYLTVID
jgi:hypothetical protein